MDYCRPKNEDIKAKDLKKENITKLECMMVDKKKVKEYLYIKGLTKEFIIDEAQKLRKENNKNNIFLSEGIKLKISERNKYSEVPVNLVVDKVIYKEMGARHFEVNKKGVKKIK